MKYKITILVLIFFSTIASAYSNCNIGYDYCINYTLPTAPITTNTNENYTRLFFDFISPNSNLDGITYAYYNLSNVWATVYNTSDSSGAKYDGPYVYGNDGVLCTAAKPCVLMYIRRGCQNGCSSSSITQICLNGSITPQNYNFVPIGGPETSGGYLKITDFTPYYRRKWTFRSMDTGQIFSFSSNPTTLTVWCNDYTQLTYNLSSYPKDAGVLTIQTIEQPKNFLIRDGFLPAIRQDKPFQLLDDYYVPTSNGINYTFILQDTTGGEFYKSYLTIQTNVNQSIGSIHVDQFDQTNVEYANLNPNQQYKFIVTGDVSSRDLGAVYLRADNNVMYVVVSRPDISSNANIWDGLTIDITSNFNTKSITCVINSVLNTSAYFDVYSTATTPYTLIYSTNSLNNYNFSFTTNVSNENLTYYVRCITNDTTYNLRKKEENIVLTNSSLYYGGFNTPTNNLESTILGIDKTRFLNFLSVGVAFIIAGLFSAISMGTGAIVFGMSIGLFYMIGYFQTSQLMIGLIIFLAIMVKMSENRFGVVT